MEMTAEIELSNISMDDLSKEDLQSKYYSLSKAYTRLQLHSEEKSQTIYDYKRELTRLKTLEGEYLSEIEALQSGERNECEKLKLKIQHLEDEKNDIHTVYAEEMEILELDVFKKQEEIINLQEELKLVSAICNSVNDNKSGIEELDSKNADLKGRINELMEEMKVLNEKVDFYEKQQLVHHKQNSDLQEQLNMLNENYNYKKEELNEAKILIENLQEELVVLKTELDTAKSKPLQDGSQGNSLFAEVDDKRLELQDRMAMMKSQCIEMKQERGKLLSQIQTLNSKNAMLCERWETEAEDKRDEDDNVEEAYRAHIKFLESQLEVYRVETSNRQRITAKNLDAGEIEFMENMLEAKNREIEKLRKDVDSFSLSRTVLSRQLRDLNVEMRHWRAKATKLESEVGIMQAQIEDLKLKKMPEIENAQIEPNRCSMCVKCRKSSILARPKLKDVVEKLSGYSNTFTTEDPYSNVDCSRQIKKSLSKEVDPIIISEEIDGDNKENTKASRVVTTVNNTGKKVQFTDDTVDNSGNNKGKLRTVGKVIHCKPMMLKKRC